MRYASRRGGCLKWALIVLGVLLLLLAMLGGWVWWRMSLKATPTRDYIAEVQAGLMANNPDDAAAPIIKQALANRPVGVDKDGDEFEVYGTEEPGELGHGEFVAWLASDEGQQTMALWREAASKPRLGEPLGSVIASQPGLVQLGDMRDGSRLLAGAVRESATAGDDDQALENLEAMYGLARLSAQHPDLLGQLTAIGMEAHANTFAIELLDVRGPPMPKEHLDRFQHIVNGAEAYRGFSLGIDGELAMWLDRIERSYTDNGRGDGVMTADGALAFFNDPVGAGGMTAGAMPRIAGVIPAVLAPSRSEFTEAAEQLHAEATALLGEPLWAFDTSEHYLILAEEGGRPGILDGAEVLLGAMKPAFDKAITSAKVLELDIAATQCLVALHRYRRDHSEWPPTLDALVGDYLDAVPVDAYTGEPLFFRVEADGGFRLWSVGYDRDNDDGRAAPAGGKGWDNIAATQDKLVQKPEMEGDLVFWPRP